MLPTNIELSGMEVSLINAMSRETILKQYLDTVKKDYQRETSFAMEQTYHLIETRYRSQKPLIITSNLTLQQLKTEDITLNRTYQRVIEMCHPVIMSGKSFRTNKANERYLRLKDRLK